MCQILLLLVIYCVFCASQTSSPKSIQHLTHSIRKINADMQKYGSELGKVSKGFSTQIQKTLRGSEIQAEFGAIREKS